MTAPAATILRSEKSRSVWFSRDREIPVVSPAWMTPGTSPPLRAAWLRPKQTDLIPDKGQFRLAFPPSAQLLLSDSDFSGSAQPTPTSSQRNTSGRAGWNGWARCGSRQLGRRCPNAGYEPHPSCGDCPLTGSEPAKKSGQNIPKNRCRTTIAERMVETRAELPFIGDQIVSLNHDQAGRRSSLIGSGRRAHW